MRCMLCNYPVWNCVSNVETAFNCGANDAASCEVLWVLVVVMTRNQFDERHSSDSANRDGAVERHEDNRIIRLTNMYAVMCPCQDRWHCDDELTYQCCALCAYR